MSHPSPATPQDGANAGTWDRLTVMIVALCFVLNMVDGMDLLVISFIAPALQQEWAVSAARFSFVFSSGLAGMALGGLGLAPLADRFGRKRLIVLSLSLMALAMVISSLARSVTELTVVLFFVGIGIGTVLACIAAVAARVAPPRHRNFAVGVLQAGYPIGAMLTGFVTAWALPLYGWHRMLVGAAGISALCVVLVVAILPGHDHNTGPAQKTLLREVIAGPRLRASLLLWSATISGFMALYFITSWITKLAIEAGLPQTQAIVASAIYNFGAFAGTLAMAILGTRIDVRRIACLLLFATIGVFLVFGGVAMPLAGVLLTAFVMGVTLQGGFNALYPIAANVYPDAVRSTGIGWAMGLGRIGAFAGPLIGGWGLAMKLPLVGVFGLFCLPLAIAAIAASRIRFA